MLVLLNFFFLGGTWLHSEIDEGSGNITKFLLLQTDLSYENVLSAWYSSMLLFLVAIVCIFCFVGDAKRFQTKTDTYINFGWIILALVFSVLSLDELGSFHETIGDTSLFGIFGKSEGWQVFYILIILVGVFMILFSWVRLRRIPLATLFMIAGVLLLLSNPMQENFEIESMRNSVNPAQWKRPVIFILLEEGSEIFATICFLVSTMIYYSHSAKQIKSQDVVPANTRPFYISKLKLMRLTILLVIIFGVVMAIVERDVPGETGNQIGIPKNWFPSILTFIVFCISLYFFYNKAERGGLIFLYVSVLSILLSAYCGIDLYEHNFKELITGEKIFDYSIILYVIILGVFFFLQLRDAISKLLVCLWALFICLAFSVGKPYSAELIFTGFSLFLIVLIAKYCNENSVPAEYS